MSARGGKPAWGPWEPKPVRAERRRAPRTFCACKPACCGSAALRLRRPPWPRRFSIGPAAPAAGGVCPVLLADAGKPLGALTFERASARFSADEAAFCEDAAALAAPILSLKRRAERGWTASTAEAMRGAWTKLASPEGRRARLWLAACGFAAAALALVPVPYYVAAPAHLEGSVQRVVVAPVDGFLEQVNVRPGDSVKSGQVLAELATQDLQAERMKRRSELAQHENVYKAALAPP